MFDFCKPCNKYVPKGHFERCPNRGKRAPKRERQWGQR